MSESDEPVPSVDVQGVAIPSLGLGTWEVEGNDATEAVRDAIELGYRQIDTARAYGNETEVGRGVAASGIDRDELWITTKLWFEHLRAPEVREQLEASLDQLGLDHVDLLLIHWPNPDVAVAETLAEMAALREQGKVVHLGVSNFPTRELAEALAASPAPLITNQVEYHPFLDQSKLLEAARANEMALTAYSPLAHGDVPADQTLGEIGASHGKNAAQVGLRWLLDHANVVVVPRSTSAENRRANREVFDFELSEEDRWRIDALPKDERGVDPDFAPEWDPQEA